MNIYLKQINWNALLLAILALLPILIGYVFFQDNLWFDVGLVTISLFVPIARIKSGINLAIVQFLLILLCFSLLFFAFNIPYLFGVLCALIAFGSIGITRYDNNLRTVANFIFIPAVYLTCELRENLAADSVLSVYYTFISLMPIALLSIIIVVIMKEYISYRNQKNNQVLSVGQWKFLTHQVLHGKKPDRQMKLNWLKSAIAIFVGVLIAAVFVLTKPIDHGEWVIWSTAAVITSDLVSAKKKSQDRLIGLFLGVPTGFFLAQFLPKTPLIYSLAALSVMLTLIAFKSYRMAFGSRCFFIAIASYIATTTPQIALERVENVMIGAVIGLAALYGCHLLMGRFGKSD